jgi:asparagine synthase (glutamine-hydrolysing)
VCVDRESLTAVAGELPQLPLYFAKTNDEAVVVSSSLDVVRRVTTSKVALRRVVSMAVGLPDPWPGETVFADVRRLTAGVTLLVRGGAMTTEESFPKLGAQFRAGDRDSLGDELRDAIIAAIEDHARGAQRVGVLVGGGLDSSGILALALERIERERIAAIAEVWQAPGDDQPFLEALEAFLNVHAARRFARDAAPWVLRSLCSDAQPQLWPGAAHDMMLWCAARELGADVVLGGYGGDIVLGGRPTFPLRAVRRALRLRVPWRMSALGRVRSWVITPNLSPFMPRALYARRVTRRLAAPWMRKAFRDHLFAAVAASRPRARPRTPDEWFRTLANDRVFSELSMSWGAMAVETGTVPYDVFRDVRVVRAVACVDPLARMDGDYHRGLYRRALRGYVPEAVRLRNDKALMEPGMAESIVAAHAVDELAHLGSLRALADLGLVEPARFRPVLDPWLDSLRLGERPYAVRTDEWWRSVWQLLSVERFLRVVAGAA